MRRQETTAPRFGLRPRLYLQIDADDFLLAIFAHHLRALAELGKANVGSLAEFQSCCNQNAVDFQAGAPLEFKQDLDQARVACAPAQHPASAPENRAGQGFDRPARLFE